MPQDKPLTQMHVGTIRGSVTAAALAMFFDAPPAFQRRYLAHRSGLDEGNVEHVARIVPGLKLRLCELSNFRTVIDCDNLHLDPDLL